MRRDDPRASTQSLDPNAQFKYKQSKSLSKNDKQELLLSEVKKERYNFTYSSREDVAGAPSKCRFVTIIFLVLATLFLPIGILISKKDTRVHWVFPWNSWLVYIIIFNTTILMVGGAYIVSTAAYPYSNSIIARNLTIDTNKRFGIEFSRCVDRMARMIKDQTETQNTDHSSMIMTGFDSDSSDTEVDLNDKKQQKQFLSSRDIYMRVAQNLELIDLYYLVNQRIIDNDPNQNQLFVRTTNCLQRMKVALDQLQITLTFRHEWFMGSSTLSFWDFFNKFNIETEKKEEVLNVKKFFVKYSAPIIPQTEKNLKSLAMLIEASAEFSVCVQESTQKCCKILQLSSILFGRSDQAKLILNRSFEGKHFLVPGPSGLQIDCMFFPCTQKEEVLTFQQNDEYFVDSNQKYAPAYLSKPTIIMCNPNALFYQQMVNAPNAYWLNFFLKRDINVMCWNYRGYGESTKGLFGTITPAHSKRDSECVLAFVVNTLQIQGKIGVYGRSIGGITACHLAQKYSDLVEVLICDRTLTELQGVAEQKLKGRATTKFFELYTNGWKCQNQLNFVKANTCYKIITCDPLDDTIDQFTGLMAGVAKEISCTDYDTEDYKLLYESLIYVCEYEERLFIRLNETERYNLEQEMQDVIEKVEQEMKQSKSDSDLYNSSRYRTDSNASTNGFRISFIQQRENISSDSGPFFTLLHVLNVMLCELAAGVLVLRDCLGVGRVPNFKEFRTFLQVMEVYGCGYAEDIDYRQAHIRATQTHREAMIIQLKQLIKFYEIILFCLEQQETDRIKGQPPTYHSQFTKFCSFQHQQFINLLRIQIHKADSVDTNKLVTDEGHLVMFGCGHRGQPSRIEEKRVSRLLRKSGFIPMLEEIDQTKALSPVKPLGASQKLQQSPQPLVTSIQVDEEEVGDDSDPEQFKLDEEEFQIDRKTATEVTDGPLMQITHQSPEFLFNLDSNTYQRPSEAVPKVKKLNLNGYNLITSPRARYTETFEN